MDRRAWDRLATQFESRVYDIVATDTHGVLGTLVDTSRPKARRDTLVDLGCGIGTFIERFGHRFAHIVGLDFSPVMIERARERIGSHRSVEWIVSDIPRAAETLADRADLAVCLNVITSVSPTKRTAIWEALRRITKPGGHALVVVPALESAQMIAALDGRVRIGGGSAATHVETDGSAQKYYARDELDAVVRRHALVPVAIERVHYPWSEELAQRPRGLRRTPFDWAVLTRLDATN